MPNTNLLLGDLSLGQATDAGRTGKNNEDYQSAFEVDWQDDLRLRQVQVAVVCDGIGGNNAGEVASKVAVERIRSLMGSETTTPIPERMARAIQAANQSVYDTSQNRPELRGMGTTVVMAAVVDKTLYLAHAGDSRAYLIRNGTASRLTLDHTWAQEAIDHGVLTPEAARVHPNRNVIKRYLGVDETLAVDSNIIDISQASSVVEGAGQWPTVPSLPLQPGDSLLLCSDGLTDEISDEELQTLVRKHAPQEAADRLVALANEHGGRDNITVTIVRLPGGAPVPVAAAAAAGAVAAKSGSKLPLILGVIAVLAVLAGAAILLLLSGQGSNADVTPTVAATDATTVAVAAPPTATATTTPVDSAPTGLATPTDTALAVAVTAEAPPAPITVTEVISGPTGLVTVTRVIEAPGVTDGGPPTSTPFEFTATPTPTSTPTRAVQFPIAGTATPTVTEAPAASPAALAGAVTVALVSPPNNDSGSTSQTFEWQLTSGVLAPNQAFEMRFWKNGLDALRDGLGPEGTTRFNRQVIKLQAADEAGLIQPGDYLWGILLVQTTPSYRPLGLISDTRTFRYERTSQPDQQPCIGQNCGDKSYSVDVNWESQPGDSIH